MSRPIIEQEGAAQGAGPSDEINEVTIEKWLTRDIGFCITMLKAIYDDPNCRRALAEYFAGQHRNRVQHNAGIKEVLDKAN